MLDANVMLQVMPLFADPRVDVDASATVDVPADAIQAFRQLFTDAFEQTEPDTFMMEGPGTKLQITLREKVAN